MTLSRGTSAITGLALVCAVIWPVTDDDFLYASLPLSLIGLVLVRQLVKNSPRMAAVLGALLVLPLIQFFVLWMTTE